MAKDNMSATCRKHAIHSSQWSVRAGSMAGSAAPTASGSADPTPGLRPQPVTQHNCLLTTGYCERTHVAVLLVAPCEERIGPEPKKPIELGNHALAERQGGHPGDAV